MGWLIRFVRRIGWGVGDQALSSLTNFALSVLIAREVSPEGFGAFSLAFATYIIILSLSRAIATEPLMVRYSAEPPDVVRRGLADTAGTSLLLGIVTGAGCIVVSIVSSGAFQGAFLALGLCLPGLMVQDAWRLGFFAGKRGGAAFVNDAIWAAVLFPGAALLHLTGSTGVFGFTMVWGGAATAAAVAGVFQAGTAPRPLRTMSWLREHRDLSPHFLGELLALSGARQLVLYGVSGIVGLAATGALRAAQLLLNPLHVLTQGLRLVVIPDAVTVLKERDPESAGGYLRAQGFRLSLGIASIAAGIGAVAYLLPAGLGEELLGRTWTNARPLLIPVTISTAFGGVVVGASVGLRALAAAARSRQARTLMSGMQLAFGLIGAVIWSAQGAAWGLAVSNVLGALVWWIHLRRAIGDHIRHPQRLLRVEDELPVVDE